MWLIECISVYFFFRNGALRMKQRQWIKDRGAAADQHKEKESGFIRTRQQRVMELEKRTKERCYELVNTYLV